MKAKDLVKSGKGFKKVVVTLKSKFRCEEWEDSCIDTFDLWEKANSEVVEWCVERKVLYITIK